MSRPTPSPVRLADLIRDGKPLRVFCTTGCRERDLDPAVPPLPGEVPVPAIGKRMRCTCRGGRHITTKPELYPRGIVRRREAHEAWQRTGN